MTGLNEIAPILLKAAERARKYAGWTFVVKLGGSAMQEPIATRGTLESLVALQSFGIRIILVHGGGKPIDRAMAVAGIEPVKVQGRRYTDEKTLEIVVKVLMEINRGIVNQLESLGGAATAYDDASWFPLCGRQLQLIGNDGGVVDLGRVGMVNEVRLNCFEDDLGPFHHIPVVPSLALDTDDKWLNVNADTVASAIAGAMQAEAAIFLTDTPGVLANRDDPSSLYARLTVAECQKLIADGTIAGGMIPKVEACLEALVAGAKRAVILDGRNPYALLGEFLTDLPAGTAITC